LPELASRFGIGVPQRNHHLQLPERELRLLRRRRLGVCELSQRPAGREYELQCRLAPVAELSVRRRHLLLPLDGAESICLGLRCLSELDSRER